MIGAVFAASGITEARERLRRMMTDPVEVAVAARGVVGATGGMWRVDARSGLLAEGLDPLLNEGLDAEHLAVASYVCGIGLRDDGLLLARGRFGGRALYFASDDGGATLLACSSFAGIVRALGSVRVRRDRLASLLTLLPDADDERTVYEEVRRLRAASLGILRLGGEIERSRVSLPPATPLDDLSPEEHAVELRRQVLAAVGRAVVGSKRVAISVSGGLDSSGVLAAALAHARGAGGPDIDVLTLHFAGVGDDRPHARALCAELGIVPVYIEPRACARRLRGALVMDGGPCVIPPAAWILELCARARAGGADRVLTGEGGDIVLDGDLSRFARRARGGDWIGAARAAAELKLIEPSSPARRVASLVVRPLVRSRLPRPLRLGWRMRASRRRFPWVSESLRPWVRAATLRQLATEIAPDGPRTDASWMERDGVDHFLDVGDRRVQFETATGVPQYMPFMDPIFVDHVRRIPTPVLFHGGQSRGLYREAMRGLIPESVRMRQTKGTYAGSVREMLDVGGAAGDLTELMDLRELRSLGLADPAPFDAHFQRAVEHNVPQWLDLWTPLAIEAFLRQAR